LLNNIRPTYLKGESELRLQGLLLINKQHQILLPNQWWRSNPMSIKQSKFKVETFNLHT
jgi:hypothetical protein